MKSFMSHMTIYYFVCILIACICAEKRGVEAVATHLFSLLSFYIGASSYFFYDWKKTNRKLKELEAEKQTREEVRAVSFTEEDIRLLNEAMEDEKIC